MTKKYKTRYLTNCHQAKAFINSFDINSIQHVLRSFEFHYIHDWGYQLVLFDA